MRKTLIGASAGAALLGGLAGSMLLAGTGVTGAATSSPAAVTSVAATSVAAQLPVPTSASPAAAAVNPAVVKTTPKPTPTTPPLVPAPTKQVASPDPNSTYCKQNPTALYCTPDAVRYLLKTTTLGAHAQWLATLKKWGMTTTLDTCVTQPVLAKQFCVLTGTKAGNKVTVLFKTTYPDAYSPAAVAKQQDLIHQRALDAVAKAKTVALKAQILQRAQAQMQAVQDNADKYNAAHPQSTVNVNVDK